MDDCDERMMLLTMLLYLCKRKKRQREWVRTSIRGRLSSTVFCNLFARMHEDDRKFSSYLGMSKLAFDEILDILRDTLTRNDTTMRESISARERLVIALRYFTTGCSFFELHNAFRIGKSTARAIVREVCEAILNHMATDEFGNNSNEKWYDIAKEFEQSTGFPHCIGSVGGKHIEIAKFRNNCNCNNKKKCFSMVIIATCDINYYFTHVDVRVHNKCDNIGVFQKSELYEKLMENTLAVPSPAHVPESTMVLPYILIGNESFPLLDNLLTPYSGRNVSSSKKIFNHRMSAVEKYIDYAFDSLANKWKILQRPLSVQLDLAKDLIKAICILHNFVRRRDGITHVPSKFSMRDLSNDPQNAPADGASDVRDAFADFMTNIYV